MFRFALALILFSANLAQAGELVSEHRLKAGFLANFMQFVRWPGGPIDLTLCAFGKDNGGDAIDLLRTSSPRTAPLKLRRIHGTDELAACQAVFVDSAHGHQLRPLLEASQGRPILVITEFDGGAPLGAMLSLVPTGAGRLGFDVNLTAAQAAGLSINVRLLQLARRVY